MKIVFIGQKGIGAVSGGVEKHVEALSTRLARHDHEVIVYARKQYYDTPPATVNGVRLQYVLSFPTKHLEALTHTFFAIVYTAIFLRRVDVIHFHSIGPGSLLWLMRLLAPRTPVIITIHAKCYEHSKWNTFAKMFLRSAEWLSCRFAQEVIVISQDLKTYIDTRYARQSHYIPNGAEIINDARMSCQEEILHRWHLQSQKFFLFVGRLIPGKKADVLVEAFNQLHIDKKLVIVGGSSHTNDYVKDLYALGAENEKIIFTGTLQTHDVQCLMLHAAVFVFPSESEGMSLVLLEAMAAHLPIIASDIVGNRMLLNDDECVYVPVNDSMALSKAMQNAQEHYDTLQQNATRAYKRVEREFSWDLVAFATTDLYYKICNK